MRIAALDWKHVLQSRIAPLASDPESPTQVVRLRMANNNGNSDLSKLLPQAKRRGCLAGPIQTFQRNNETARIRLATLGA